MQRGPWAQTGAALTRPGLGARLTLGLHACREVNAMGGGRRGSVEDAHCKTERTFKREEPGLEHPFPPHYMTHAKPHPLHS